MVLTVSAQGSQQINSNNRHQKCFVVSNLLFFALVSSRCTSKLRGTVQVRCGNVELDSGKRLFKIQLRVRGLPSVTFDRRVGISWIGTSRARGCSELLIKSYTFQTGPAAGLAHGWTDVRRCRRYPLRWRRTLPGAVAWSWSMPQSNRTDFEQQRIQSHWRWCGFVAENALKS